MIERHTTYYKAIKSGNCVEYYEYSLPDNFALKRNNAREDYKALTFEDRRAIRNKYRSTISRRIKRLIRCNPDLTRFWTLTFEKEPKSYDDALIEFKNFFKRLNYRSNARTNIKYIAVAEYGVKNGRLHFHFLCNRYIEKNALWSIWGNGFVKVKCHYNIEKSIDYITKYITKTSSFDDRTKGRKIYFTSRNLQQPLTFKSTDGFAIVDKMNSWTEKGKYKYEELINETFDMDFIGSVVYKRYNLVKTSIKRYNLVKTSVLASAP